MFAMGASGKSLLTADMALACLYGVPWKGRGTTPVSGVMVVDYEDTEEEWRLRVQQLCDGYGWAFPEAGYRYMPGRAVPLADQVTQIRRIVTENHIGLIIVDSAASACGGDLLDVSAAARLINALTDLGVTSLLIAHNTKAEDSKYPYGNIFWHNLVRATHYVETTQDEGSSSMDSVIYNRKANRGLQKPISIRTTFSAYDTGATTIELLSDIPDRLRKPSMRDDVRAFLMENGASDASTVHEATHYSRQNIAEMLRRDQSFIFVSREGKRMLYGVASKDVSPYSEGDTSGDTLGASIDVSPSTSLKGGRHMTRNTDVNNETDYEGVI